MKKISVGILPGLILLLFLYGSASGQVLSDESLKFSQVLNWIDKYYVDSVNKGDLVEDAIIKMLHSLDPHSTYLTKDEVKQMNEPLQGNFEGIGISFNILDDTIFVVNPIPGGPSERVGIIAGDRIILINGENVAGMGIKTTDVFKLLRGKKGTEVKVSVLRRSGDDLIDFKITRDKIPIYSLDASYMIDDRIGYIKLNRFSFTTIDEFESALMELKRTGAEDLILDLGGNGGGYMEVAVKLADQFLGDGKLVVYTEGTNNPKRTYTATSKGYFEKGRVVIIIDEGTASASEIVAGAVQDWDRGIIVGRRSFGKGLVQNPMLLIDSSMVRLTIARYYTPSGRLIQKPYDKGYDEYSNELDNRFYSGELTAVESKVFFPDSLKYRTLQTGRIVYGGGGIMPDYFVPLDTSFQSDYYRKLINRGILNIFVLNYVDDNREKLNSRYPDFNSFNRTFETTDEILTRLTSYAESQDLTMNTEDFLRSRDHIKTIIKAYIARDLWKNSDFYQVYNTRNETLIKAIEVLRSAGKYQAALQALN